MPALADRLRTLAPTLAARPVVVGFDGFVDEMITPVRERRSLTEFAAVPSIAEFAQLTAAAAGRSSCREVVIRETAAGGCAVNLGDGLAALGVPVHGFATLGEPVHAAFRPVIARWAACRSWGDEPGRTLAFEFGDGKLMYPAVAQLARFTPEHLRRCLADGAYAAACAQASAIAFTNWSLYPHMTACWQVVQREVLAGLRQRPLIFVDLVDPSARTGEDLRAMLAALAGFGAAGEAVLGINFNEAGVLGRALGLPPADAQDLAGTADRLRTAIGVARVVLHTHHAAAEASAAGQASAASYHTPAPKRSVGAGDRFNAGYVAGCLLGLSAPDRLATACAVAGAFVRQGASATMAQAAALIG